MTRRPFSKATQSDYPEIDLERVDTLVEAIKDSPSDLEAIQRLRRIKEQGEPVGECATCKRKVWSEDEIGLEDRARLVDGMPCRGTFVRIGDDVLFGDVVRGQIPSETRHA